jgi:hypothetical protein
MAGKLTGLGWTTLSLDDGAGSANDIKNDTTNFNFTTPRAVQDVTGVDKFAIERLLLLADFSGTLNGVFNVDSGKSHATLKTVPLSTSPARTLSLGVASQTLANEVLVTDYQVTRDAGGALTWQAPFSLADGTVPAWS